MSNFTKNGYGTPYFEVYDGSGKLLVSPNGEPLGKEIEDVFYEYSEDGDDNCRIIFMPSNYNNIADHPSLKADTQIFVKWGYLETNFHSPKRLLAIRDTSTKYGNDGIIHTLICSDKASYLKTMQVEEVNTENFVEWLGGIGKRRFHDVNVQIDPRALSDNTPLRGKLIVGSNESPAYLDELSGNIVTAIDNTAVFNGGRTTVSAGMSVWKIIRDKIDASDDGPYVMDGTDGVLDIRKRDFDQPAIRSFMLYTEKGDDVISFEPESKIRQHEVEIANFAVTDPNTNEAELSTDISIDPTSQKNGQLYESLDTYGKQTYELLETLKTAYKLSAETGIEIDPNQVISNEWVNIGDLNTSTPDYVENGGNIKMATESTSTIIRAVVIPKSAYWSSEEASEILEKIIINQIKDDHVKKYQAILTIQGDPKLKTNMTIVIGGNIANLHKGKYYITAVKHHIGKMGYTCEISLLKNPPPITFLRAKYIDPLKEVWEKNRQLRLNEGKHLDTNQNTNQEEQPKHTWPAAEPGNDLREFQKQLYEDYGEKAIN